MADLQSMGLLMDGEVAIQPEGTEQPFVYRGFQMVDETKFRDLTAFKKALLSDPARFATSVTSKLMIYALGRGLEAYDMPSVRRIVRESAAGRYQLSSIVLGIVKSPPFQMRQVAAAAGTPAQ